MAKMFYTLEEAAQKLAVSQDQVKQMATGGKLQQFRDRDKLMFKRDQVDAMAAGSGGAGATPTLKSAEETDQIDLTAAPKAPGRKDDPRAATGISVFDADEVSAVDPMAQTQITKAPGADEEELALESVGSGSGLLDLTRESDDTSLGAELLDEIYPGSGGEASDAKQHAGGAHEPALTAEASGGASGLENLQAPEQGHVAPVTIAVTAEEANDPAGSGLGLGVLIVAAVALVVLLIVGIAAVSNVPSDLVKSMASNTNTLYIYTAGGIVGALVLGLVGFFVGKAQA